MADISKIKLPNGDEYNIKDSNISVTQKTSTGTNIADITIHGTTTSLYAPSGGGGGIKNVWYATCSTGASTQAKVASTTSNDFALTTGNMVRVLFTNGNSYNGTATLNVDGAGAKDITRAGGTTTRYYWTAGEVVDFVYNGSTFDMVAKGTATTTYYGLTKLSSSTSSTSEALAATPKAVKTAYDLADSKSDFSGSYTDLTNKPTIPTDTGDLTNGAGYLTDSDLVNLIYPIGSIYMSVNNVSPQTFLGGEWQSINGRFLVAQGDNGESGDEALNITAGNSGGYTAPQNSAHSHGAGTLAADSTSIAHTHNIGTHYHSLSSHEHTHNHYHNPNTESYFLTVDAAPGNARFNISSSGTRYTVGYSAADHFHGRSTTGNIASGSTTYTGTPVNSSGTALNYTGAPKGNTALSSDGYTGAMVSGESHGHTISGSTDSISAVTSGNLPPYLAVYMWKRTA